MCIKIYLHSPRSILGRPQPMPVSAARDIEVYLELCQRALLVLNIQNRDVGDSWTAGCRKLEVFRWFFLAEFNIISSWPSFQCTTTIEHQEGSLPLPFTAVRLSGCWTSQMLPDILTLSIVSYYIALFRNDHARKKQEAVLVVIKWFALQHD